MAWPMLPLNEMYDHDLMNIALEGYVGAIHSAGTFAVSDTVSYFPPPRISVDGVGHFNLPLPTNEARDLFKLHGTTPQGPAESPTSLSEPSVAQGWATPSGNIHFNNPNWEPMVDKIVKEAVAGLGCTCNWGNVRADLCAMMIDGVEDELSLIPMQVFLRTLTTPLANDKRSVEYSEDAFAKLVICLPSEHAGGALTLQHGREMKHVNTDEISANAITWLAWYTDVELKMDPLTSGVRWLLTYNLVNTRDQDENEESASKLDTQKEELVHILDGWQKYGPVRDIAILPLDEHYAPGLLQLHNVDKIDRCRIRRVADACAEKGHFEVLLANLETRDKRPKDGWECEHNSVFSLTCIHTIDGHDMSLYCHLTVNNTPVYKRRVQVLPSLGHGHVKHCFNCVCGPRSVRYTTNDSVIVIVPKAHITSFLLGSHGSGSTLKRLLGLAKETAQDAERVSQCLLLHCENVLREKMGDKFLGPIAVNAVLTENVSLFARTVAQLDQSFTDLVWWELGNFIDISAPVVPEALIIEALTKSRKLSVIYDAAYLFLHGLETRSAKNGSSSALPVVRGWHDTVLLSSLDMLQEFDSRDADILIKMIMSLKDQHFRQFIVYQGIRQFIIRSLANQDLTTNLPLALAFALGWAYPSDRYLRRLLELLIEATIPDMVGDRFFLCHYQEPSVQVLAVKMLFGEVETYHHKRLESTEIENPIEGSQSATARLFPGSSQDAGVSTFGGDWQNTADRQDEIDLLYEVAITGSFANMSSDELDFYNSGRFIQCLAERTATAAAMPPLPDYLMDIWIELSKRFGLQEMDFLSMP